MSGERRLRIWVITPELHRRGGTERCLAEQLTRWQECFDLRVYTMQADPGVVPGLTVRRISRPPGPHLARWLWWFAANRSARWWDARRLDAPDLVHSPGINGPDVDAMSVHIVFGDYRDRAARATVADLARPRRMARAAHRLAFWALIAALERRIYTAGRTLWAPSRAEARELERRFGRPPGSVPIVHHGVDTRAFCPAARGRHRQAARERLGVAGARVLLVVANDAHNKGVDTAVRALGRLPRDVVLAVAGGVDAGTVGSWARAAGVATRVRLWPHTSDVLDYYAAADALLAPSRRDAFSQPVMEALACGLPVVVSAAAGASELVEHGLNALVLRVPRDAGELAGHLRCILDDTELAARLGAQGRALAQRHSWDDNARQAAALLEWEATLPRFLVLAPAAGEIGGIGRVTRTLLRALVDLYGSDRAGVLNLCTDLVDGWGDDPAPAWVLDRPASGGARGAGRVPPSRKAAFALRALRCARAWRRRLVVVAAHPHLAPVARACAAITSAPYAVWCHGVDAWGGLSLPVRAALRRADLVFAPSAFTARAAERAAGLRSGSVQVVPHSLPPEMAPTGVAYARGGDPLVLAVTRLVPADAYKGVDTLLRAWPQVTARVPDARLLVVGEGPDRVRLERIAAGLGLDGSVAFAGRLDDAALGQAYARAAVFALPGRCRLGPRPEGEGFGLVFVEAAAAGLPVVAGRGGGATEAVADGDSGLLVDPEDPQAVADAIVALLADPERARRMGARGRELAASRFSYDTFRARVGELVRDLSGPD